MLQIYKRPFLSLLPFLILYVIIILLLQKDELFGDEGRYLQFAHNLLNGFYSPPPPDINLWNGPGFPIYLMPFVAFDAPVVVIKLFNALLHYCTLLFFFHTLLYFIDSKKSFTCTVILGLYYMPYKGLPHILSETFTIFLIASITFLAVRYFSDASSQSSRKSFLLLALLLAFLALTKVIFGMVYLISAALFLLLYFFRRNNKYGTACLFMVTALLCCTPYLFYTYSLTNKVFYWSNAGGMSFYWMSNPAPGEWGEWYNDSLTSGGLTNESRAQLQSNHKPEFDALHNLKGIQRDDRFKTVALQNIREHPGKYILNWLANCSRMFFNYPVGYHPVRTSTVANMIANIPLLILLIYASWLSIRKWNEISFAFRFLLVISGIYLFGSSLLSAYDRMLYILIPVLGAWIAYCFFILRKRLS